MAALFKLSTVVSLSMALCACSPATAPLPGAPHADGTVNNGVISYAASDFHEPPPGRNGGTLRVSAASDAGSFDIHALSNGNRDPAFPPSVSVAIQADLKKVGFDMPIEMLPLTRVTQRHYAGKFRVLTAYSKQVKGVIFDTSHTVPFFSSI